MTLTSCLGEAARRFGDAPAHVAENGLVLSYADLDRVSDEVAVGLGRRGIGEGDVLALALPTIPEYIVLYLAAAKLGAITAGVNTRLSSVEQEAVLAVAQPALVLREADVEPASNVDGLLGPWRVPSESPPALRDDPNRPVALVFTSGTTGLPKGVLFCNRQLDAVTAIDVGDRWGGGPRGLASTSLAHLGPMTKLAGNLRGGGTTFLMRRWSAGAALRAVAERGVNFLGGIPTQIALMLEHPSLASTDLSSLQAIIIGGGPATPALVRAARSTFGVPLAVRYSCTEAAIGCGTKFDDPPEDAEVSVGRAQAGVTLSVLDDDDQPVAVGEVGHVCLRSGAVMAGYWHDPEATAAAFTADGSVRTGDLGWVDDVGRLHLAGRSKEMYVRGGYNVHPQEVEAVLAEHPGVTAVCVVARPDDVMGEVGVAFVVGRRGAVPSLEALREFGRVRLAAYKLPEEVRVVDALPLTSMDKVDRKRLAALLSS
ncbi:MAG TPA: class I adenylate-forming enzyme family protein [Acidimicrobiales bacterium]|nr:class I adenylate-forming enzyme family protein [Acidimicrobiales bacterium]